MCCQSVKLAYEDGSKHGIHAAALLGSGFDALDKEMIPTSELI